MTNLGTIRRYCPECDDWTPSVMVGNEELCARCPIPPDDDDDDDDDEWWEDA